MVNILIIKYSKKFIHNRVYIFIDLSVNFVSSVNNIMLKIKDKRVHKDTIFVAYYNKIITLKFELSSPFCCRKYYKHK